MVNIITLLQGTCHLIWTCMHILGGIYRMCALSDMHVSLLINKELRTLFPYIKRKTLSLFHDSELQIKYYKSKSIFNVILFKILNDMTFKTLLDIENSFISNM